MSRDVFHLEHPRDKHEENSLRGIDEAWRLGYPEIDIDLSITKDGRICANHWPELLFKDGFRDPLHRISKHARFNELTYFQVRRLIARTGRFFYRVQPIEKIVKRAKKRGVGLVLEPKSPEPRFKEDWVWEYITTLLEEKGVDGRVYGFVPAHLAAARRWGLKADRLFA